MATASQAFHMLPEKAGAYESLGFLTLPLVIVAALCVMAFWFIFIFLLVLPAFPLFVLQKSFPVESSNTVLLSIEVL